MFRQKNILKKQKDILKNRRTGRLTVVTANREVNENEKRYLILCCY